MNAVLNIAKGISRSGEGSLIIIANRDGYRGLYETHYPQISSTSLLTEQGMNVVMENWRPLTAQLSSRPRASLSHSGPGVKVHHASRDSAPGMRQLRASPKASRAQRQYSSPKSPA